MTLALWFASSSAHPLCPPNRPRARQSFGENSDRLSRLLLTPSSGVGRRAEARQTDICNPPYSVFKIEHPYLGRLSNRLSGFPNAKHPKAPGSLDECPDLHVGTHPLRRIAAVIGGLFDHHDTDSNRTSDAPSPPPRAECWALTLALPLSETTKTVPRYRKPCKPGNAFQPRTPSTTEYLFEACPIPQHATSRGTTLFARGSS
jgi:hypothetical protein